MRLLERALRRRRTAVAYAANGTALVLLVAFAATAVGQPVHHASLNDGGIWVVNGQDGYWGRFNKPAEQLDGAFWSPVSDKPDPGTDLDVLQDGPSVLAWNRSLAARQLYPVDVSSVRGLKDQAVTVAGSSGSTSDGDVSLAGGTAASIDPATGLVHAIRTTSGSQRNIAGLGLRQAGLTRPLGGSSALVVGLDGTVHAVSAHTGSAVELHPSAGGGMAAPAYRKISPLRTASITAVGGRSVVYDGESGTLVLPTGRAVPVARSGVLQQAGPDAPDVLLATSDALWSVALSSGVPTRLAAGGGGVAAAPVLLPGTVHAAWGGTTPIYVRVRGHAVQTRPIPPTNRGQRAVTSPVFRVNRGQVLLNDASDGGLWLVDQQQVRAVDDWPQVEDPQQLAANTPPDPARSTASRDSPQAVDQTQPARAGRTSVLHLLDAVKDPSGAELAIVGATQPDDPQAHVASSADLQTVSVELAPTFSGPTSFTYTISDGRHPPSTARVTVTKPNGPDEKPFQREAADQPVIDVALAGTVSIPVLSDWRDPENDALSVQSVASSAGQVALQPDAQLRVTAPPVSGDQKLTYLISDGFGGSSGGQVTVHVLGAQEPASAATAQDDVVAAVPGVPVTFSPLGNDLPGADPAHPDAHLALAGPPAAVTAGLAANVDLSKGQVTVSAAAAGDYSFSYADAFGSAPLSRAATVRVVVHQADSSSPVATPDVATLHGLHATLVDVLANDFSPAGGMLGVVSATVDAGSSGQLQASVVKNHWLQVQAVTPVLGTGTLSYVISDGQRQATGQVSVVQVPDAADPTPLAVDDTASVRAGDVISVPVLDNDVDPDGEPLSVLSAALDAGTAPHTLGFAGVAGNLVRYAAPDAVSAPTPVVVQYGVRDLSGAQATGHVYLTIVPPLAPTDAAHDQPPAPLDVTATVVAGGSAVLPIPTTGVDPDGDGVTVIGVDSPPALGRITGTTAGSMTYQAFPSSAGTDVFSYVVEDRYGKRGSAGVQVLVLPPGPLPAPVAVDDAVRAKPGAEVSVPVLANDVVAPGDTVSVEPLRQTNGSPAVLAAATLDTRQAGSPMIDVRVPKDPRQPLTVVYGLTDGSAPASLARVVVTADPNFGGLPPVPHDDSATASNLAPGDATVVVDVLANDFDWDGATDDLSLPAAQAAPGAKVVACPRRVARCLSLPVLPAGADAAYLVRNAAGLSAVGVVHVPGTDVLLAPRLRAGLRPVRVSPGGTAAITLADLVVVRPQHTAKLYQQDSASAAPRSGLTAANVGFTGVTLTASAGFQGQAAVVVQVTDGVDAADPAGLTAFLTIPVQVGADLPVLRCPTDTLAVVVDDERDVQLPAYCHLWVADGDDAGQVRFSVDGAAAPGGLTARTRAQSLLLTASGSALAGAVGSVSVTPTGPGGRGAAASLPLAVVAAPADVLHPVAVTLNAGARSTVDLTPYLSPVLPHAHVQAIAVGAPQGGVTVTARGTSLIVTAAPSAKGAQTVSVQATDAPGNPQRQVTGSLTVTVLGKPDRPGAPAVVGRPTSRTIELAWPQPADNGSPITGYTITGTNGATANCTATPCSVTGLTNGQSYTFHVVAHNAIGDSDPSDASPAASPQAVPGAVAAAVTPHLGGFHVSWASDSNQNDGSVDSYSIESQPPMQGLPEALPSGTTSLEITSGFDFDTAYVINVVANNVYGNSGDTNTGAVQAWSTPDWQGTSPKVSSASQGAADEEVVDITFSAVDWQGAAGTYVLKATGGPSAACTSTGNGAGVCRLPQNGGSYSFYVTATNGGGVASDSASSPSATAADAPDAPASTGDVPTGQDNSVLVSYTFGDAHDSSGPQKAEWSLAATGPFDESRVLGVMPALIYADQLADGPTCSIWIRAVNNHGRVSNAVHVPNCIGPYGQADAPSVTVTQPTNGSGDISWSWTADPGGGHGQTLAHYTLSLDGGPEFSSPSNATQFAQTFQDWGQNHTLKVEFVGQRPLLGGQTWPSATGTGNTGAAPQPSLSASRGDQVVVGYGDSVCTHAPGCPALDFTTSNFPTGYYDWKCAEGGVVYLDSAALKLAKIDVTSPNEQFNDTHACVDSDHGVDVSIIISVGGTDVTGTAHFS